MTTIHLQDIALNVPAQLEAASTLSALKNLLAPAEAQQTAPLETGQVDVAETCSGQQLEKHREHHEYSQPWSSSMKAAAAEPSVASVALWAFEQ
jgi:hypothetical protein